MRPKIGLSTVMVGLTFTKIIVKVGNHKNVKLVKNKPERV